MQTKNVKDILENMSGASTWFNDESSSVSKYSATSVLPYCPIHNISLKFMDKASVLGDDYKILIFLKS